MKGKISLVDFIKETKAELRSAIDENDPFFFLDKVELEVTFGLDVEAEAGTKFFVFDTKAKFKGAQTHKVTMSLTPFARSTNVSWVGGADKEYGEVAKEFGSAVDNAIRRVTMDFQHRGFFVRQPLVKVEVSNIELNPNVGKTDWGVE